MAAPRAQVGERWLIRGIGWRRIIATRKDKHGRLYGIRCASGPYARFYPLYAACSVDRNWGRYVRSRDLIKPDRVTHMCRRREARLESSMPTEGNEG